MAVIEVRDAEVGYEGRPSVFPRMSLRVASGDRVGIAGESGCGKTTLLRAVSGLLPSSARISGGLQTEGRIGYIPQESLSSLSPYLTIDSQLSELTRSRQETVRLLQRVGLSQPRYLESFPHQLSGGERQRVLALQALALRPDVIVADEPTSNLDRETEAALLGLFDEYCSETGAGILIASHRERVFDALQCRVHRMTQAEEPSGPSPAVSPPVRTLVRVRNLTKTYFRRAWIRQKPVVRALNHVSFEIGAGEAVAVTGPSGAGKSTLARLLAGRDTADSGTIEWSAEAPLPERVQLVQQEPSESLNPRHTIADALREACGHANADLLLRVRLPSEWINRRIDALSEGQRARVSMLRSVARLRGGLLILDESLAGLDPATRSHILLFLREEQATKGLSVLLVTHDLDAVAELGARLEPLAGCSAAA